MLEPPKLLFPPFQGQSPALLPKKFGLKNAPKKAQKKALSPRHLECATGKECVSRDGMVQE